MEAIATPISPKRRLVALLREYNGINPFRYHTALWNPYSVYNAFKLVYRMMKEWREQPQASDESRAVALLDEYTATWLSGSRPSSGKTMFALAYVMRQLSNKMEDLHREADRAHTTLMEAIEPVSNFYDADDLDVCREEPVLDTPTGYRAHRMHCLKQMIFGAPFAKVPNARGPP